MIELSSKETFRISGGIASMYDLSSNGSFDNGFKEQITIYIDKNSNDTIVFNDITFSSNGSFYNGVATDPKKTYSGYYIRAYDYFPHQRGFILNR